MGRCFRQAVVTMMKSYIMQASLQFPVQLLLLDPVIVLRHPDASSVIVLRHPDASSSHCPQTPRRQLQSVQAPQYTSKPLRSPPWDHAQVPRLLQGRFASEFEQDGGARASWPREFSSSIIPCELSRLAECCMLGLEANGVGRGITVMTVLCAFVPPVSVVTVESSL